MIRTPPSPPFARSWRAVYRVCYAMFESGVAVALRVLFRVRRVYGSKTLPAGGVLVCPNHESYLDPALVQPALARRLVFVMTNDFYRVPGAVVFFRLVGAMPVAKGRLAWATMRRAAALLRLGHAVVVFPEGRIAEDGEMRRFQRGVALLARRARVPVVPVAIAGSGRAWARGAKWLRLSDVRVAVGTPLVRGDSARDDDQAFADRVYDAVAALKKRIPPSWA